MGVQARAHGHDGSSVSADIAIQVEGVSKRYPLFAHPWHAVRYLASLIWRGSVPASLSTGHGFQALSNIGFNVGKGERVGLVGRNGAGKSTILKLLAGNFPPTTGQLVINGSVYSLFPGAVSFSFEQSAEENARQYLSYLGLPPKELQARIDEIREFTELGEYFYQPTKNLSLGMRVRAEFAVATAQSADVVIIDEVLGAGDIYWSEKIARRMEKMCAAGTTLLLVSHSLSQVNRYCERAVWIERGCVLMDGPVLEVTKRYEGFLERLSWQTDDVEDKSLEIENAAVEMGNEVLSESGQTVMRWPGRGDVIVAGVWINEKADNYFLISNTANPIQIKLALLAIQSGEFSLRYLITFWNETGKRVAVIENISDIVRLQVGEIHTVIVSRDSISLLHGKYHVTVTVSDAVRAQETTNEFAVRQDVIYKSFVVEISQDSVKNYFGHKAVFRLELYS